MIWLHTCELDHFSVCAESSRHQANKCRMTRYPCLELATTCDFAASSNSDAGLVPFRLCLTVCHDVVDANAGKVVAEYTRKKVPNAQEAAFCQCACLDHYTCSTWVDALVRDTDPLCVEEVRIRLLSSTHVSGERFHVRDRTSAPAERFREFGSG